MSNPTKTCGAGELGPIIVWQKENAPASCDPSSGCQTKEVCVGGVTMSDERTYASPEFQLISDVPVTNLFAPPFAESPFIPTLAFTQNFVVYSLSSFMKFLNDTKAFAGPVRELLKKAPFDIYVSNFGDTPIAAFSDRDYAILFGYFPPACALGADADVVIHEFAHMLTYTLNPKLGMSPADIEGNAMHEAISDAIAAIYFNDTQIGEGVTACFDPNIAASADIGIRRVDDPQGILIPDTESHGRSELYSVFFWRTFKNLETRLGSTDAARALMISIIFNSVKFMPTPLAKRDIVKAMMLSALELDSRIHFTKNLGITMKELGDIFVKRGLARGILKRDDIAWLSSPPSIVKDPASEVEKKTTRDVTFVLSHKKGGVEIFDQLYKGTPVVGASLNFIYTPNGIMMVDNTKDVSAVNMKTAMFADDAAELFKAFPPENLQKLLQERGASATDIKTTLSLSKTGAWLADAKPVLVMVAGKKNAQYMIAAGGTLYFVDAITGEISAGRTSY